ncbi:glycosyltransferase [Paremcibacter congregatus]|uniref:glycosyltransferase n=1 Tax=Paremcibacter congregatus TaxID=2043170 RepID=UPI003C6E95FD|tara:strand:- start:138 stop:1478 length:1341 start_codon:yes stop_codon:yes gene_type:complete
MKILIVAGYFPPFSPASASRINKFAKYMHDTGHDVMVLAPENKGYPPTLTAEIPQDRIIFTDITNINEIPNKVKHRVRNITRSRQHASASASPDLDEGRRETKTGSEKTGEESALSRWYRKLTNIPDDMVGWYPHGVKAGRKLFESWSPDLIFCTTPPHSGLFVARRLAAILDVPWVVDFRDLWTGHGYYNASIIQWTVDTFLEKLALRKCKGMITVTESWAKDLKEQSTLPVEFARNGFDPKDFSDTPLETYDAEKVTIIYAGLLYGIKRDPSLVLEALGKMGDKAKYFRFMIYTANGIRDLTPAHTALIEKYNLQDVVENYKYIPQADLLKIQQQADLLLLLRWDDPKENGVIAGKLFEYIGSGTPILATGSTTGEAADIVRDNDFGLVSNDVDEVVAYLEKLLITKQKGDLKRRVNPNREQFTRTKQFEKLVPFMEKIIADSR